MIGTWPNLLPEPLLAIIGRMPERVRQRLEEIRIRESRPLEVGYAGRFAFVTKQGTLDDQPQQAYRPTHEDCMKLLDLIANHSLYTLEEELKRGYVTVPGGHRVGLAGRTVVEHGKVKLLRDISGFNIRIAREVTGAAESVIPHLLDIPGQSIRHTLIISPPQQGKTTLIRDLARVIGYGIWRRLDVQWSGMKVGIVDERSEIAACVRGVPRFDVGPRTDVLDGCPKAEGMMMLIRSMSPQVLIVDEIGREEDAEAIQEAMHAGIAVIATAHGRDVEDARRRPILSQLMEDGVFSRYVVLRKTVGQGVVSRVMDAGSLHEERRSYKETIKSAGGDYA